MKAEHCLGRQVEQRVFNGARGACPAIDPIVMLVELIAVDRVGGIPGVGEIPSVIVE
jgi:hypothetical protein